MFKRRIVYFNQTRFPREIVPEDGVYLRFNPTTPIGDSIPRNEMKMSGAIMVINLHFDPTNEGKPEWLYVRVVDGKGFQLDSLELDLSMPDADMFSAELQLLALIDETAFSHGLTIISMDTNALGIYLKREMPRVCERLVSGRVQDMDAFIRLMYALPLESGFIGPKATRRLQSENTLDIYRYFRLYERSIDQYTRVRSQLMVRIGTEGEL